MESRKSKGKKHQTKHQKAQQKQLEQIIDVELSDDSSDYKYADVKLLDQKFKINQIVSEALKQPINFLSNYENAKQSGKRDKTQTKVSIQSISTIPSYVHKVGFQSEGQRNGGSSAAGFRNSKQAFSNPVIYESTTTTTSTTTTRTVKVNRENTDDYKFDFLAQGGLADQTEIIKHLFETGLYPQGFKHSFLDNSDLEDLDPKLGELIYTDQPPSLKEVERKAKWINVAYGPVAEKSLFKTQLLQLVEYNKIEIHESEGSFLEQSTDIEIVICKLMKQRLMNDELKQYMENHQFQGLQTEQHSLIYSIIKLTRRNVSILYKKCWNVTMIKQIQKNDLDMTKYKEIYVKDLCQYSKYYIDIARKMGDLYEEMVKKAQFFRVTTAKIFDTQPGFRYIQNESIMKGFFFLFIYKDFVLREVLQLMNEILKNKVWQILAQIERDYFKFMESELVEWVNLMLATGVFQSYSSVVSPNQSHYQEFKKKSDGSKIILPANEGQNFYKLQKRYIKLYTKVQNQQQTALRRNKGWALVDSDLDDENFDSEMDELFSLGDNQSADEHCIVDHISQQDSDDEDITMGCDLKTREQKLEFYQKYKQNASKEQQALFKGLNDNIFNQQFLFQTGSGANKSPYQQPFTYDLSGFNRDFLNDHLLNHDNDDDELSNQASTNETVQNENKKKKKRRKNKKKKKKKTAEEEAKEEGKDVNKQSPEIDVEETDEDPAFEEDLKQFQMRLMQSSNDQNLSGSGQTPYRKLKPNVSDDWLITIREKSKSLSDNFPKTPQMTLVQ